ncbi:unnamed protein product [Caenorhabditis brenneri]
MGFRLLRLPFCALKVVLDLFVAKELLRFSFCSVKCKVLVKSIKLTSVSKDQKIDLWVGDRRDTIGFLDSRLRLTNLIKICEIVNLPNALGSLQKVRIGNFFVPIENQEDSGFLVTYWDDRLEGINEVAKYVMEIFKKPIHYLFLGTWKSKDDPRWAIDWINRIQGSIASCYLLEDSEQDDQQITYLLNNSNVTERFFFYLRTIENFQYTDVRQWNMEVFYVKPSKWVTRDLLLILDCEYIGLEESKLTNQDLNSFLKHWSNGGFSKLKEVRIGIDSPVNYDIALEGIEVTRREVTLTRSFVNFEGAARTISGGLDIQRGNTIATVDNDPSMLWMVVWANCDANENLS